MKQLKDYLYWETENGELYNGEALEILKTMPDESVNCVISSPPYFGLRDYGTAIWEGGDKNCDHNQLRQGESTKNSKGASRDKIKGDVCRWCGAKRVDKRLGRM